MTDNALARLRASWFGMLTVTVLILGMGWWLLAGWWRFEFATRWAALAACLSAYVLGSLWVNLPLNYRAAEQRLISFLGIGNTLTVWRGIILAMLAGFFLLPRPVGLLRWLPGILFTAAVAADFVDGYLARRTGQVTHLGEMLDLRLDGLAVLIGTLLVIRYAQAPSWFLLVGLARYLFVIGIWVRRRMGKKVHPLPPSQSRRPIAGVIMGATAILLFPVFTPPATHLAAALFSLPFLAGFTRDYLAVSGKSLSKAGTSGLARLMTKIYGLTIWLPLLLRSLTVIALATWLIKLTGVFMHQADVPPILITSIIILTALGFILLSLGAVGRAAALCVLFAVGLFQNIQTLTILEVILLIASSAIFYLGTGRYSLWAPENKIIVKRLGEA